MSQFFRGPADGDCIRIAAARPSPAAVTAFLKEHGIDYIFADERHPNTLVPGAIVIATSGDAEILRVP